MHESVLCVVYMAYCSLDSLTVGLGYHWHLCIHSLVQSYWMWTVKCVCTLYEGQYGSAIYGDFICAIRNSDAIFALSYLLIFKYIFWKRIFAFHMITYRAFLTYKIFKNSSLVWTNNYRPGNISYVNENINKLLHCLQTQQNSMHVCFSLLIYLKNLPVRC
jgi:hypothetical protein